MRRLDKIVPHEKHKFAFSWGTEMCFISLIESITFCKLLILRVLCTN